MHLISSPEMATLRGPAHNILKSFLEDRKQYVEIGNKKSDKLLVNCRVPQGSVLGPLLFLIYINDLPSVCNDNKVTLFADDTNIYGSLKNGNENYKNCLTRVFEWMTINN